MVYKKEVWFSVKDNHMERTIAGYIKCHLEKSIPEGTDLWPTIHARLTARNLAAGIQCRQGMGWFAVYRIHVVSAILGVLVVVMGGHWWMIQPKPADAQEILSRAQVAQALSTSSGIHTFTLTQEIDEKSSSGQFHAETKRWYQEPGRWRIESSWTGTALVDENARTVVSDGTSEWVKKGDSVTISRAAPLPETDDLTPWGRERSGLTDVLNQVGDLYTSPNLKGEETIAGRSAYVIDLGLPNRFSNSDPELNNGRRVIWVDKETFFLLKAVQYSPTDGSVAGLMEVTHIRYNIPIDPGVFSFTPPLGAHVYDLRSGNHPSLTEPNSARLIGLAEARRKVSFSIFIPTMVPAGLVPESPILEEGPPALVKVTYYNEDGSTGFIVFNGPAGSGLAADPRKQGETIRLRGDIQGHFLNIEPQFGGPILWWEEAGSYVALSGPELNQIDLVKIAVSMSPTADIK